MQLKLPKLPYQMNALEPHLDANALEIHYRKHHSGYLQKLNDALRQLRLEDVPLEEILANVSQYPPSIRNYAGGFYNHSLFWQMLTPDYQELNDINLTDAIIKYFGTFEKMKEEFTTVALNQF
ncbi:MAG TPA: superoxide dismutase, partial [Prolixibacteraceae bacterium]|nr:superoxide dismutase [Prolixibacteraceae bacterium]